MNDNGVYKMKKEVKKNKIEKKQKKTFYFFCKRIMDILLSLIGLIFFVIVAIIVKISYMLTGDFK